MKVKREKNNENKSKRVESDYINPGRTKDFQYYQERSDVMRAVGGGGIVVEEDRRR